MYHVRLFLFITWWRPAAGVGRRGWPPLSQNFDLRLLLLLRGMVDSAQALHRVGAGSVDLGSGLGYHEGA